MARRVLDHTDPIGRTLVVAGNAHTSTALTENGIPMGAWLAGERPGLRSVTIKYGAGVIDNLGQTPLASRDHPASYRVRFGDGRLLLDHPSPPRPTFPIDPTSSCSTMPRLRRGSHDLRSVESAAAELTMR